MLGKIRNILVGFTGGDMQHSPKLLAHRRYLCTICPMNTKAPYELGTCTQCGCFLHQKTQTASERCPAKLW